MTATLGTASVAEDLIPGDAGAITRVMYDLRDLGDSLAGAGGALAQLNTQAGWQGAAAEAFRSRFGDEPPRWNDAGSAFHDAASALDRYATALVSGQDRAATAITTWRQGVTLTAQATEEAAFDPGLAHREEAERILAGARRAVDSAGWSAEDAVRAAFAKAPQEPGFWSKVGSAAGGALDAVGDGLYDVAAGTVNGLASFGNAMINHPGDLAATAAGIALMGVSAGGEGLGVALDATGVGAVAGVPLNVVSAAGIVAGGTLAAGGLADLTQNAVNGDRVTMMESRASRPPGGSTGGRSGVRKTDSLKEHLTDRDLDAARRELDGEVVARKSNGDPWDHVTEVKEAQRGLLNRIRTLKQQLSDSRTTPADRPAIEQELSDASRLFDHTKGFVPWP